jgi:pantoate--beta-alanine ligase
VREPDGLAMSSRNRYLSPDERQLAPALFAVLSVAALNIKAGADIDVETMEAVRLLTWKGFQVDYVAVRDAETLGRPVAHNYRPLRVLAAVRLGGTRLIDNVPA